MEIHLIIGNIFALLSVIFVFISVIKKNKKDLIGWQVLNVAFCIFANIALFAYAALTTNFIALIRNMLAYKNKLTPMATFVLSILCIIVGWYINNMGIIGWLAIIATTGYTILMCTTKSVQQMRFALLFSSGFWVIHDFYVQSYPTVISGCFLMGWTLMQILRYRKSYSYHKI